MNEYVIQADQVSDHKLEFTCTPNPFPSAPNKFWMEYPFNVNQIHGHDVFYPLLPLFLALGFDDTRFHLASSRREQPGPSTGRTAFEQLLGRWLDLVEKEATGNFGKKIYVEADVEGHPLDRNIDVPALPKAAHPGGALFLGDGDENLFVPLLLRWRSVIRTMVHRKSSASVFHARFVSSLRKTSLLRSATIRAGEGLATLLAAVIIKYFVADIRARNRNCIRLLTLPKSMLFYDEVFSCRARDPLC